MDALDMRAPSLSLARSFLALSPTHPHPPPLSPPLLLPLLHLTLFPFPCLPSLTCCSDESRGCSLLIRLGRGSCKEKPSTKKNGIRVRVRVCAHYFVPPRVCALTGIIYLSACHTTCMRVKAKNKVKSEWQMRTAYLLWFFFGCFGRLGEETASSCAWLIALQTRSIVTHRSGEGEPYSCGTLMAPWGAANIILVRVKRHDLMSGEKKKKNIRGEHSWSNQWIKLRDA